MNEIKITGTSGGVSLVSASELCYLCGQLVDKNDPTVWKQVVGFVGGPKKDSMRLREDTGYFAHDACVARIQEGQAIDQPGIFDLD